MYIIAGRYKGHKLFGPPPGLCRPSKGIVREALFNILVSGRFGNVIEEANVLDVCAGTGALALEALSRGAASAVLIEQNPQIVAVARSNISKLREEERATIIQHDILRLPVAKQPASVVFIDPPYKQNLLPRILKSLESKGWLQPDALIIIETAARETLTLGEQFAVAEVRRYGKTELHFLRYEAVAA